MVRLQRFELKIRPMGFQDTPDSAHMVPRPPEPKLGYKLAKNPKFEMFDPNIRKTGRK